MSTESFTGKQTVTIVGISYRQLDHWARTNLIRPSVNDAAGSGSRRAYNYRDLLELKVVKKLLDAGIRLESIRDVFSYLRDHLETDIASAHLVISGKNVILCDGGELIDLINRGQGVFNVIPLSGIRSEVDATIISSRKTEDEIRLATKIVNS